MKNNEVLELLEKVRNQSIVLAEFVTQFEQLTGNQLTGVVNTLKEIDESVSKAYVLVAAKGNKNGVI